MLNSVNSTEPKGHQRVSFANLFRRVTTTDGIPARSISTQREQCIGEQMCIVDFEFTGGDSIDEKLLHEFGCLMSDGHDFSLLRFGECRDLMIGNLRCVGLERMEFGESFDQHEQCIGGVRCRINRSAYQVEPDLVGPETDCVEHVLF